MQGGWSPTVNPRARPARFWMIAVAVAALLAHGGCLGSTFYLDDWTQIVDCDAVDQGQWYSSPQRALTYLTYFLTYRVAGMSAVAFHAGNLLLHVAVSLALLGFAREFLADAAGLPSERARRIGGWAAVLFAVHPLMQRDAKLRPRPRHRPGEPVLAAGRVGGDGLAA